MTKRGMPFVEINAKDNYDFGFKLGKKLKEQIQYRLKKNKEIYKKKAINAKDFSVFIDKSKKFIPAIKRYFPHLLEEARAMAEGAEVPFEELFVLMCDTEIINFKILHCLSIAVRTKDNKILLGNNEDWVPEYRKNGLALIKGQINNHKFMALSYIGSMVGSACGLSSSGIAYTDNSFILRRFKYKVPRSFHLRALLDARNIREVIKILDTKSLSSNTMIVKSNSTMIAVEELFNCRRILKSKNWLIHSNHPLNKKDQNKKNTQKESVFRYNLAKKILLSNKNLNVALLKKIFSNHQKKYGTQICEHPDYKKPTLAVSTISSVIINPKDRWMLVCSGNPCKNKYKKYKL